MSELTREAAEARDLAVRRTLELVNWGDDAHVRMQDPAAARTIEERAAILRRAMYRMCTPGLVSGNGRSAPVNPITGKASPCWRP